MWYSKYWGSLNIQPRFVAPSIWKWTKGTWDSYFMPRDYVGWMKILGLDRPWWILGNVNEALWRVKRRTAFMEVSWRYLSLLLGLKTSGRVESLFLKLASWFVCVSWPGLIEWVGKELGLWTPEARDWLQSRLPKPEINMVCSWFIQILWVVV